MPKIKVRIHIACVNIDDEVTSATFIVEAPSPISAMAKFSGAANTMPYTGPITDEPAGYANAENA